MFLSHNLYQTAKPTRRLLDARLPLQLVRVTCANTIGRGPIVYKRIYLLGAYILTTRSYKRMRLTSRVYGMVR